MPRDFTLARRPKALSPLPLPENITLQILTYVDHPSLAACAQVSKRLDHLAEPLLYRYLTVRSPRAVLRTLEPFTQKGEIRDTSRKGLLLRCVRYVDVYPHWEKDCVPCSRLGSSDKINIHSVIIRPQLLLSTATTTWCEVRMHYGHEKEQLMCRFLEDLRPKRLSIRDIDVGALDDLSNPLPSSRRNRLEEILIVCRRTAGWAAAGLAPSLNANANANAAADHTNLLGGIRGSQDLTIILSTYSPALKRSRWPINLQYGPRDIAWPALSLMHCDSARITVVNLDSISFPGQRASTHFRLSAPAVLLRNRIRDILYFKVPREEWGDAFEKKMDTISFVGMREWIEGEHWKGVLDAEEPEAWL